MKKLRNCTKITIFDFKQNYFMSTKQFAAVLFLIHSLAFSQPLKNAKIFLDSTWNVTTEANHKYYRIIKDYYSEKDSYQITDHYKSGTVQMIGNSKYKDLLHKEGQFIYYYENGSKESVVNYIDNLQTGKQFNWYQNGQPKSETEYFINPNEHFPDYKIFQFWDSNGNQKIIDGNGEYETKTDNYYEIGKLENGLKQGTWQGSIKSSNLNYHEIYDKGKLTKGTTTDSQNIKYEYTLLSSKGGPKKGLKHFYQFLGSNFNISNEARANNITGKIVLSFNIESNGNVSDLKVTNGLGYGLDEEAIRIIKNYKDWIPAKSRGISHKIQYIVPITIQ